MTETELSAVTVRLLKKGKFYFSAIESPPEKNLRQIQTDNYTNPLRAVRRGLKIAEERLLETPEI